MIHDSHYYEGKALHALEESKRTTLDDESRDRWAERASAYSTLCLAAATVEAKA